MRHVFDQIDVICLWRHKLEVVLVSPPMATRHQSGFDTCASDRIEVMVEGGFMHQRAGFCDDAHIARCHVDITQISTARVLGAANVAVPVDKIARHVAHDVDGVSSTAFRFSDMLVLVKSTYGQMPLARSSRPSAQAWSNAPAMYAVRLSAMR